MQMEPVIQRPLGNPIIFAAPAEQVWLPSVDMENREQVRPYDSDESKKNQVTQMFDNIAPRYDLLNRVLSLGIDVRWRKRLVRSVVDRSKTAVLDIATGTGDVAILLGREPSVTQVVGLDISSQMLQVARGKVKQRQLSAKIDLVLGDSENLPQPDNTFDAVTVAFGVRNFEDVRRGLQECHRVLKPGGSLHVLEFSQPQATPFRQIYQAYFRYILPLVGRVTSRDPKAYTYLFESVQAFPAGKDFANVLQELGFRTTTIHPLTLGICTLYVGEK